MRNNFDRSARGVKTRRGRTAAAEVGWNSSSSSGEVTKLYEGREAAGCEVLLRQQEKFIPNLYVLRGALLTMESTPICKRDVHEQH